MLGAGNRESSRFGMTINVYPEPKLTLLPGGGTVHIDEAVDDNGNSLVPKPTRGPNFITYGGYGGFNLFANLQYPTKNPGKKIVRFRGSTTFMLQTKVRDFQIVMPLNAHDIDTDLNGMPVMFRGMNTKPDYYEVRMSVPQSAMQHRMFQSLQSQLMTRMRLLDDQGNEIDHRGMGQNMDGTNFEFTVQFARNNRGLNRKPTKLIWEIPLESREITVPLRFTDIPLFDDN
jgi:hypothetical protein